MRPSPARRPWISSDNIYENAIPVTIVGSLAVYANMVMEKFAPSRTAGSGASLEFSATFRQIRIVSGQLVEVPESARAEEVKDLAATEQHQGRKQPGLLSGDKEAKASSWALQITDALGLTD